jgi:3-deoxy-D-manno-octulosonate 8-phosphate phosphatase (KDO 8-P phosphatase)
MNILQQFKPITAFFFGIEGVLTAGKILVLENGESLSQLHIKDEYALQIAIKKGYRITFISGSNPVGVRIRLNNSGIGNTFLEVPNKREKLEELVSQFQLDWNQVLFMGQDLPDLSSLQIAGISCAPADAAVEIKQHSKYVSPFKGGEGCVRDVIEKVLKINADWEPEGSMDSV